MNSKFQKIRKHKFSFLIRAITILCIQKLRVYKFLILSDNKAFLNDTKINQPILFSGEGVIEIGKSSIGFMKSPSYLSTYAYFESRSIQSKISIGDNVYFNNNACIIAERSQIKIKDHCLIGPNLCIFDSDFHDLDPRKRNSGTHPTASVLVEENVFIGSNVTILKGVTIGKNSVIASSSVVTKNIPDNVIAGGNPAIVIRSLKVSNE